MISLTKPNESHSPEADESAQLLERIAFGLSLLRESVTVDPEVRGGVPVLKDTRFPLSRILAELAAGASITQLAEDYEIDEKTIRSFLEGLAIHLDRPVAQ